MTKYRQEIFRHVFNIMMLLVASSLSSCVTARNIYDNRPQKIIIIYYDSEISNKRLLKAAGKYGSEVLYVSKSSTASPSLYQKAKPHQMQ